jgi:adenylate cyclase
VRETRSHPKPTLWQRMAVRKLRRAAGRKAGEPLEPEDWAIAWRLHEHGVGGFVNKALQVLPRGPRCGVWGAPYGAPGRWIVGPLGYRPSRKNPTVCGMCVEFSPPGGTTMYTGVLFADLRGFTARFRRRGPTRSVLAPAPLVPLRRRRAFPGRLDRQVIGDEVMALYLPDIKPKLSPDDVPALMLERARELLRSVGYGSGEAPFVETGIGIDVGEAFVGNIGQRALYDFTAIGDVVNTASRLQGQAAGGEVVLSARVAQGLSAAVGTRVELELKGKRDPQPAYRVTA